MMTIYYSAVDGARITKRFKHLESAREWAQDMVGDNAEIGRFYAVSGDGIGKIECEGVTLKQLFGREA